VEFQSRIQKGVAKKTKERCHAMKWTRENNAESGTTSSKGHVHWKFGNQMNGSDTVGGGDSEEKTKTKR